MNEIREWVPISKVDEDQRMVYGYASTWGKDSQGEVVEKAAMEAALPSYMRFANIREMHQPSAVGVAKSAEISDDGLYIGAKVVDESAWEKVKEGVYKGFSIGGKAISKIDGVIKSMVLTEISLVDRPANPEAVIDVFKADTSCDLKKYAGEEAWDATRALEALNTIYALWQRESTESHDNSEQLGYLNAAINGIKQFIQSEIMETSIDKPYEGLNPKNLAEVEAEKSESTGDIAKAGATYSAATKAALAEVHDMLKGCVQKMDAMGYQGDETEKADKPSDIAKIDGEVISKLQSENDDLKKRIAEFEAQPKPAKAATMAIAKGEDVITDDSQTKQPTEPIDVFKMCLSNPI